jgi:hypothetical protein
MVTVGSGEFVGSASCRALTGSMNKSFVCSPCKIKQSASLIAERLGASGLMAFVAGSGFWVLAVAKISWKTSSGGRGGTVRRSVAC